VAPGFWGRGAGGADAYCASPALLPTLKNINLFFRIKLEAIFNQSSLDLKKLNNAVSPKSKAKLDSKGKINDRVAILGF
jgi:hypothetical protein